jgi:peptidoglycan/LPS O-acetylase OafA/YrhL
MLYFFSGCLVARYIEKGVSLNYLLIISIGVSVVLAVLVQVIRPYLPLEMVQGFFFTLRKIPIAITFILLFIVVFRNMKSPAIIKLFKNLGNMTYSTYMVHFPLQIVIFLILEPASYTYFNNPLVLLMFVSISVGAGWIVFEYFEKPAQKYLRQRYSPKQREMPVVVNMEEKKATG